MQLYQRGREAFYRYIQVPFWGYQSYNSVYWNTYNFSLEASSWSKDRLEDYQLSEFRKVIRYSYNNSKYYKVLFNEYGINPSSFKDLSDIKKLPILSKNDVNENIEQIRALPMRNIDIITTGGSTGKPSKIYLEKDVTRMWTSGFVLRAYNEAGYFLGDRIATIRGDVIKSGNIQFFKNNNELVMPSFHLSDNNLKRYITEINKFKPKFLRAYPSSAAILAKYIEDQNIKFNEDGNIKALLTSSENLTKSQRVMIEKSLNVKIYDHYGNCEQNVMITQCKYGNYHDYMEYSFTEYLDENNQEVEEGIARVIGTNFGNRAMPLIRFDTGDRVILKKNNICKCGKKHKVVERVIGRHRQDEMIIGKEGNKIPLTAVNSHANIFDHVYRMQYVQEIPGEVLLRIQPRKGYTNSEHNMIIKEMQKRMGENINLIVEETDKFETTVRGKSKLLIQNIDLKQL